MTRYPALISHHGNASSLGAAVCRTESVDLNCRNYWEGELEVKMHYYTWWRDFLHTDTDSCPVSRGPVDKDLVPSLWGKSAHVLIGVTYLEVIWHQRLEFLQGCGLIEGINQMTLHGLVLIIDQQLLHFSCRGLGKTLWHFVITGLTPSLPLYVGADVVPTYWLHHL